ncbi:hypothetical protein HMPREF9622_00630 [Cutibacterium modestum HL037PA3]|uniref:Tat pathway signal sequence domain protein n=1 Tax=Cutibacterium modestum HL044PA1 TaxID=765109 RepID=A0ABN0C8Y5_9ACTN|nr:hypothetical protein HMPREF9621_01080 [Cutibacterium modestum HL037PA2]EFS93729.1 hypothetical protein HMPREF9607_00185 [Cutibacterium modestum HL044PA1]EFT16423.1 hypothetical protein HMPREF9622_00630 [Cutibacterium modestum HL037PA3]
MATKGYLNQSSAGHRHLTSTSVCVTVGLAVTVAASLTQRRQCRTSAEHWS